MLGSKSTACSARTCGLGELRQFDVFRNPSNRSRDDIPFVVVVQSHLLDALPTAIVAPMLHPSARKAYTQTSATVRFRGELLVASLAEIVAIDVRYLKIAEGNLIAYEDAIRRALDRLFTGF